VTSAGPSTSQHLRQQNTASLTRCRGGVLCGGARGQGGEGKQPLGKSLGVEDGVGRGVGGWVASLLQGLTRGQSCMFVVSFAAAALQT
jgi:hypothetical protein